MANIARITGTTFISRIRRAIGSPSTGDFSDTDILNCVDQAQLHLVIRNPQKFRAKLIATTTFTTASGTADYELTATDVLEILEVENTTTSSAGPPRLKSMDHEYLARVDRNLSNCAPRRWMEYGEGSNERPQVKLSPTPDGAYSMKVWYIKIPTAITATPNDISSDLPQRYDLSILGKATELALTELNLRQDAMAQREFNREHQGAADRQSPKPTEKLHKFKSAHLVT